ncbi:serine hydrolase domain-containing protein [Thermomonas flagellata]|uniref:serine hydrolase domain-containing protein n=1 Tax=Thermomonas flagellata TaxID=2888524 RepID=UPI0030B80649
MGKLAARRLWPAGLAATLLAVAIGGASQIGHASAAAPASTAPIDTAPPAASPAAPADSGLGLVQRPPRHALAFDPRDIERLAAGLVASGKVPGLALAIVQDGRILSLRGYGVTDVHSGEPIDAHTVFRLASLSKSFAGTLTGLLVNDGLLRWDSRLTDYVPQFRLAQPGAAEQVTLADLLSHRVGLTRNAFDRDLERDADPRSLVLRMANAPMACAPGQCYAYQNVAFSLIGDVVFAATGQFYGEAVARRIFKPLGMHDASYGLEGLEASARWARPHVRGRGGWVPVQPKPNYYRVAPAAGVNASISDMAQWLIAQLGDRPDVLPAPLLATLHRPLVDTPVELHGSAWRRARLTAAGYALGWRAFAYAGHPVVFHGGAVQGYRAAMALLPEQDLGVAILWNSESALPSGLLPTVLDRALGLPGGQWIEDEGEPEEPLPTLYARGQAPAGADASAAQASPH